MKQHTYVIRVARDALGRLVGHLSDPIDGWRRPFANADELWRLLSGSQESELQNGCHDKTGPPDPKS